MIFGKTFIIALSISQLTNLSYSANIICAYKVLSWTYLGSTYYCDVYNNPNITTREAAVIESTSGRLVYGTNSKDVVGFNARDKIVHYFPSGLEKAFGDLKGIQIFSCGLKEVHQEDLKPFTKLGSLSLFGNEIKVLEKGLFEFNPMLGVINLEGNKIVHIDVDVFNHLSKLEFLKLRLNACIDKSAYDSTEIKEIITEVQEKCQNQEFLPGIFS